MKKSKNKFEIKKLFSTPKRAVITLSVSILALAILGTTSVFSAYAIAENVAIGEEAAKNNAFEAAGVDFENVDAVKTKFKFHRGKFVYDVKFYSEGKEFEYKIHSKDGVVVGFEKPEKVSLPQNAITADEAKEIALTHAGLVEEDVTFTKVKIDKDDGIYEYEIEFKTDSKKYEYEINAEDGQIIESKSKNLSIFSSEEAEKVISVEDAKKAALEHAGITDAFFTKAKLDKEDGIYIYEIKFIYENAEYKYKIDALTKEVIKSSNKNEEAIPENIISEDEAKNIALTHAGLTAENVSFKKSKLDKEEGKLVYDIEFLTADKEYEYEIHAESGEIIEFSSDDIDNKESADEEKPAKPNENHNGNTNDNKPQNPDFKPEDSENDGDKNDRYEGKNEYPMNPERPNNPEYPMNPEYPNNSEQKPNPRPDSFIGLEKAKKAVLEKAGLSTENVTFTKAKLEKEKGRAEYEIEFTCDGKKYEFSVNALTGEIIEFEVE
ncbi:MAG: hypothetical protein E7614_04320 [Ruminococcaceae bacterium]|nr:hypothetical protein [Oscillospiraceae bacterium]